MKNKIFINVVKSLFKKNKTKLKNNKKKQTKNNNVENINNRELKLKMKRNITTYIFADGEYMHVLLAP
jgi:hypothetical protein